jgi:hypothetical protein
MAGSGRGTGAMYIRMAQEDDESVVRGLFLVQARPWSVALDGLDHS